MWFPGYCRMQLFPQPSSLVQEHLHKDIENLPDSAHTFQKSYLSLRPSEQEAFLSAQVLLFFVERTQREEMMNEHSHKLGKILKELAETTNKLLQQLQDMNRSYFNKLEDLTRQMTEMRVVMSEVGRLGVPTLKRDGFSVRLEALKKNHQAFVYPVVLEESGLTGNNKE